MENNYKTRIFFTCISVIIAIWTAGCKKNLPEDREYLAANSQFTQMLYQPVLGRNTLFTGVFNPGNSSLPLTFNIVNMRRFSGEAATELEEYYPVKTWKKGYDGTEKSLAEIEAKRTTERHRLFEVREHSGQFLMWAEGRSNLVKAAPDSGYVFDVEVSNTGGRKIFRNFKLKPFRERSYEPSPLDPTTGQSNKISVNPSLIFNIKGERTGRTLGTEDIQVIFRQLNKTGHSLTFKFVDSLFQTINPDKFAATKWDEVAHGFNMQKDAAKVSYDVAFPIPLAAYPTRFTNASGTQARSVFRWDRIAFGNELQTAQLGMNYNIYEQGDWEIIFWFMTERPKFTND